MILAIDVGNTNIVFAGLCILVGLAEDIDQAEMVVGAD